ncbi:MAG: hypothetical protein OXL41_08405 [Nitrospinae bacterium]|nr:hypothetical protein [Nitrospinota bacterium]
MPYKDPEKGRQRERERHRRRVADRRAQGLCIKCGKHPPAPERSLCEVCGERGRAAERARYARGKAAGDPYGGRNPDGRRRMARERNRKRRRERKEAGLCTRCGELPPAEGSVVCEACREARRAEERKLYAARRAKGLCGRCGGAVFAGASRCGPCTALEEGRAPKKNAASRARYTRRRAQKLCVDCAAPSGLAARCESCARRSWHSSGEHKGLPLYPPRYTVIELATGEEHGPWDSWEEVAMCLAFERLSREEVEIVEDTPVVARYAGW